MAKYKCSVCGFVYDEEKEGRPFSQLQECPVCRQPLPPFSCGRRRIPGLRNPKSRKFLLNIPGNWSGPMKAAA